MNTPEHDPARPLNIARRCLRWLKRFAWLVLSCLAFYLFMALIGLIPVNRDFRPTPDGIEIWFISKPIHTDIILPIHTGALDWRERFPAKPAARRRWMPARIASAGCSDSGRAKPRNRTHLAEI